MTEGKKHRSMHPWMHCTAGMVGGSLAAALFYPLDFLRTRMHTINPSLRGSPICSVRIIVKTEGVRGMYRGLGISVASHSIGWGLYLLSFHSAQRHITEALDARKCQINPAYKDFASACVAATTTGALLTPLHVIKTRRQLSTGVDRSSCRGIASREGWKKLFKGVVPQIVLTGNTTIQVTLYEFLRRRFFTNTDNPSPVQVVMASAVSKAVSSALFNPLEVVRTRLQAKNYGEKEYKGMMDGLASIWRAEGLAGMYRGLPVNVARVIPSTVFAFVAYEKCLSGLEDMHRYVSQWTFNTTWTQRPAPVLIGDAAH